MIGSPPSLADPYRDAQGVPTQVPASATVLRVLTNSYHSQADDPASTNVYANRALMTVTPFILNAPKETTLGDGAVTLSKARIHYDNQGFNALRTKANVTTERRDKDGVWIDVTHTYDTYGNRLTTTQPSSASPRATPRCSFMMPRHTPSLRALAWTRSMGRAPRLL
jgi:hypothetical protein